MKGNIASLSLDEIAAEFERIRLLQYQAVRSHDNKAYNRLFTEMMKVEAELRARDRKDVLARFYSHANPQVRLHAAGLTLAVHPELSRQVLQTIRDRAEHPFTIDAGFLLEGLEKGTFVPP